MSLIRSGWARLKASASKETILQLALLYLSRTGSIIVAVIFLPLYSRMMGAEQFGIVAVILSLQALLIMLDLGMSTILGRELAIADRETDKQLWLNAEMVILLFYGILFLLGLMVVVITDSGLSVLLASASIMLFWVLVTQNLAQTVLLAKKQFNLASGLQIIGVLSRAGLTYVAMKFYQPSVNVFVLVQLGVSIVHLAVSRYFTNKITVKKDFASYPSWSGIKNISNKGKSLIVFGIAGAAVMQLDKPIIAHFMSPASVAPYFLAMSFSSLPGTLLSTPIVQYFQPEIIRSMNAFNQNETLKLVKNFTRYLFIFVAVPACIIWAFIPEIIRFWLNDAANVAEVSMYAKILLPAFALGNLCYTPVVLLLAVEDFKYQAYASVILTCMTLVIVMVGAIYKRVDWVSYAYVLYFMLASISVWMRSNYLTRSRLFARVGLVELFVPSIFLVMLFLIL